MDFKRKRRLAILSLLGNLYNKKVSITFSYLRVQDIWIDYVLKFRNRIHISTKHKRRENTFLPTAKDTKLQEIVLNTLI